LYEQLHAYTLAANAHNKAQNINNNTDRKGTEIADNDKNTGNTYTHAPNSDICRKYPNIAKIGAIVI